MEELENALRVFSEPVQNTEEDLEKIKKSTILTILRDYGQDVPKEEK